MNEIKVFEARAGSQFAGNEEAQIGVRVVDGELPRDGAAVRQMELNAGKGTNPLLKSRCGCRLRHLKWRWGVVLVGGGEGRCQGSMTIGKGG